MPIDLSVARGAEMPSADFERTETDVLLHHLTLGGRSAIDPRAEYPGISIDLTKVLHGTRRIDVHRPLPARGKARATALGGAVLEAAP